MRCVLMLICVLGCVSAQVPVVSVDFDSAGQVRCSTNNTPIIFINRKLIGTPLEGMTLAHEQTHVRQMRKNAGGCIGSIERYQASKLFRVTQELEAYCVEMDYAVRHFDANADSIENRIIHFFKVTYDTSGVSCKTSRKQVLAKDSTGKLYAKKWGNFFHH